MSFPFLETERLHLVEIGMKHSPRLYEIFSLDEVTRYYGMDSFRSLEQAVKMIESFAANYEAKRGIRWGMVNKANGELIGTIGLNNLNLWNKRAEIGFETHPAYWRGGYTSEAVREVVRYSFAELGLQRMGAVTFPANTASSQLLLKMGFQKEGLLRGYLYQNGRSHDALLFSLLQTDQVR